MPIVLVPGQTTALELSTPCLLGNLPKCGFIFSACLCQGPVPDFCVSPSHTEVRKSSVSVHLSLRP